VNATASVAPIARRVWIAWAIAGSVAIAASGASMALWAGVPRLLTEHARPIDTMPAGPLVVTASGKLFHRPACRYVHGPASPVTAEQAVAGGYTACTRCMSEGSSPPEH
jgi:hypothetical protein